ncbi:argininosuccinate lyase, partial [Enterocloster citroniae]
GDRVTDKWAKSGNNWYYLDSDGEMAIDTLIEDGDNYYYVDINGVMASNQWVAIDNEDAGEDDEPEHYWYYFQANGKALKNSGDNIALKTINGKKYAFDDEGKMLYGWVASDNAERIDNTDGDAFKDGVYYFGGEDDGAMTVGWLQMDITYDEATSDYEIAPVFNDDEDQSRWFYFKSNGKKVQSDSSDDTKEKTINGKKYAFDQYGAMVAEWSLDIAKATSNLGTNSTAAVEKKGNSAQYSRAWRYFNSVEDGARVSKGWFKVVAAEYLNEGKYNDDEDAWYYADGSGNLYAGEFKTIKGKKYAFRNDGRMVNGLKFINETNMSVVADDDDDHPFDTEDDFIASAEWFNKNDYLCYYFGDGNDGAMKTNKTTIAIDGDNFNFYFEKSGSKKGSGVNGEKDDKYYLAGMLLKAGSDEKYQAIQEVTTAGKAETWKKLDDAQEVLTVVTPTSSTVTEANVAAAKAAASSFNKKAEDLKELYVLPANTLKLINTSGKVIDKKGKSKDGNDYVYVTDNSGVIRVIYVED